MSNKNRTALITGSGRNIGRAIALGLAKDGYNIVLNGSSRREKCEEVAAEAEKLGAKTLIAMGDVGVEADVKAIAQQAIDTFGSVDILINNARYSTCRRLSRNFT